MVRGSGNWIVVSETVAIPLRFLRGESTTTYASSKLNRVGRRAARYDSGLSAHKYNRPAHKRLTPHRIAHGQIACARRSADRLVGRIYKIKLKEPCELETLLDRETYLAYVREQG